MVFRETDLSLNEASLGKYLKASNYYPELSKESCTLLLLLTVGLDGLRGLFHP